MCEESREWRLFNHHNSSLPFPSHNRGKPLWISAGLIFKPSGAASSGSAFPTLQKAAFDNTRNWPLTRVEKQRKLGQEVVQSKCLECTSGCLTFVILFFGNCLQAPS